MMPGIISHSEILRIVRARLERLVNPETGELPHPFSQLELMADEIFGKKQHEALRLPEKVIVGYYHLNMQRIELDFLNFRVQVYGDE